MPAWWLRGTGRRRLRPARCTDEGFTLVEVMWALVIFVIVSVVGATTLIQTQVLTFSNRSRVAAASIAQRQIEQARSIRAADLVDGMQTLPDVTLNGTVFHVSQQVSLVPDDSTGSACTSSADGALGYKRVSVTVTWDRMNGVKPVRSDTLRALGIGDVDQTKGAVAVAVKDRNGQPLAGQTVTLTPGGGSQTTGPDGCAVFGMLSPAWTYTATLKTPSYVDTVGQVKSAQGPIVVDASVVSKVRFDYDKAATLRLAYDAPAGYQPAPKMAITLASDTFPGNRLKTFLDCSASATPCVTGEPRTISSLFPSKYGYAAYAGQCADAAPATATQPFPVSPGGTSTGQVALAGVNVQVAAGFDMYAVHPPAAGCASGVSLYLGKSGTSPMQVALPYGTWILSPSPDPAQAAQAQNQVTLQENQTSIPTAVVA